MTEQAISERGLELIQRWEGLRLEAYRDVAGVWTIGYGTTDRERVSPGMRIDEATAERWLRQDVAEAEAAVRELIDVPLGQAQFDALVSFTYNVGTGALERSTLRRRLNAGEYDAVPAELAKWVHAGGRRVRGLINRRRDEADLWESDDSPHGSPPPLEGPVAPGSCRAQGEPSWIALVEVRTLSVQHPLEMAGWKGGEHVVGPLLPPTAHIMEVSPSRPLVISAPGDQA